MNDSHLFARGHAFKVFPSTDQRLSDPLERQLLLEQLERTRVCALIARSQPLHSLTPLDFQMGLGRPVDTNPLLTSRNLLQSLTPANPDLSNTLTPAVNASFGSQVENPLLGQARATHRLDPLFNVPLGFSPRGSNVTSTVGGQALSTVLSRSRELGIESLITRQSLSAVPFSTRAGDSARLELEKRTELLNILHLSSQRRG
jgi:hypothetical protein